jgi:hypothetical protein
LSSTTTAPSFRTPEETGTTQGALYTNMGDVD